MTQWVFISYGIICFVLLMKFMVYKQTGKLLPSVRANLSNSFYVTGCRALGLIDKIVTGPLWRKLQESFLSILDMGGVYCDMKTTFDSWNKGASSVIMGVTEQQELKFNCIKMKYGMS